MGGAGLCPGVECGVGFARLKVLATASRASSDLSRPRTAGSYSDKMSFHSVRYMPDPSNHRIMA